MFTVRRLGVSDRLARSLSCTNVIESMISVVRELTDRVKRWQDARMVRRWVGAGMLEAERSFRRIKGCKDMPALVAAVRKEVAEGIHVVDIRAGGSGRGTRARRIRQAPSPRGLGRRHQNA
jgi:hypothetical protein